MVTTEEKAVLKQRLIEAENAYHELSIGRSVVEVAQEGLGKTQFKAADIDKLKQYIAELKHKLNPTTRRRGTFSI